MIYAFHAGDYARLERADGTSSKTLTGYVFSYERSGRFHSFISSGTMGRRRAGVAI